MSQDLTSMIEEINNVSATLSKTNKPDNPVSILQASESLLSVIGHLPKSFVLVGTNNLSFSSLYYSSRRSSVCLMGIYRFCSRSTKALRACSPRLRQRRRRARGLVLMGIMVSELIRQMISIGLLLVGGDERA